jgi:hypothetical protein
MQTCTACGKSKELAEFGFRNRATGLRHRVCKRCVASYGRQHYEAGRAEYIARSSRLSRTRARELQKRVADYLSTRSCVDCGESDPLVLDFDHIDPATKRSTIHNLVSRALSWARVLAELERCHVRCANCHRRRTAAQFGWAKLHFGDGV